jgi:glutaredoxin
MMLGRRSNGVQDLTVTKTPEDERLANSGPRVVTLYTRPDCHLCEEAKALIEPILQEFGATLREVNIDADGVLRERYGLDIPVIFIGAHKAAKHRVDAEKFRLQLKDMV